MEAAQILYAHMRRRIRSRNSARGGAIDDDNTSEGVTRTRDETRLSLQHFSKSLSSARRGVTRRDSGDLSSKRRDAHASRNFAPFKIQFPVGSNSRRVESNRVEAELCAAARCIRE